MNEDHKNLLRSIQAKSKEAVDSSPEDTVTLMVTEKSRDFGRERNDVEAILELERTVFAKHMNQYSGENPDDPG